MVKTQFPFFFEKLTFLRGGVPLTTVVSVTAFGGEIIEDIDVWDPILRVL
jgi:hypothetical protein